MARIKKIKTWKTIEDKWNKLTKKDEETQKN